MAALSTLISLTVAALADDGTTAGLPFVEETVLEASRAPAVRQSRQTTTRGGMTATRVSRTDGERRASKTVVTNGSERWTRTTGHSAVSGMGRHQVTHSGVGVSGARGHATNHRSAHAPVRVVTPARVVHTPVRTVVVHPTVVHAPPRVVVRHPAARTVVVGRSAPRAVVYRRAPPRTVVVSRSAPPPPPHRVIAPPPDPGLDRAGSIAFGLGMGSLIGGYAEGGSYGDLGFGVSGRYRPASSLGLQLDVAQHRDAFNPLSERDQTQVAGSVALFAFSRDRVQPYVLGGLTYTGRQIHDVVGFADGTVAEVNTAQGLWGPHAGLGLEFAFGRSLAIDVEGRLVGSLNHLPTDPALPASGLAKVALQVHF